MKDLYDYRWSKASRVVFGALWTLYWFYDATLFMVLEIKIERLKDFCQSFGILIAPIEGETKDLGVLTIILRLGRL